MIARLLIAVLALVATPALAQDAKAYGVPEIAALAASKTQVVRVAITDGNDQPAGLVSFLRAPGEEPRVEVRAPPANAWRQAYPPMTATISAATWREVVEDGAGFDIVPAPPPPSEPGKVDELALCMHGWGVTVEAVDANGRIRRRVENACAKGVAVRYGFALAKAAVAALPACATLDASRARNAVSQLASCHLLYGDRAAAAEAYNAWNTPWFANPDGPEFARPLAYLFYDFAEVTWPREARTVGMMKAAEAWTTKGQTRGFRPKRVIGETADRVRMEGVIWTRAADGARSAEIPATMVWTRENGFGFRVRSFKPD